jgi:hypothetical protein
VSTQHGEYHYDEGRTGQEYPEVAEITESAGQRFLCCTARRVPQDDDITLVVLKAK